MSKRYYAVYTGSGNGEVMHAVWADVEERVADLLRGNRKAKHHGFDTKEEAINFAKTGKVNESLNKEIDQKINNLSSKEVIAFTDGSYYDDSKMSGYGALLFTDQGLNKPIILSGQIADSKTRNFIGETEAVKHAIQWAIDHYKSIITIYHDYDYDDINKKKHPTSPEAKDYYNWVANAKRSIHVKFISVKGHDHVAYNEEVDKIAKEGARGLIRQ